MSKVPEWLDNLRVAILHELSEGSTAFCIDFEKAVEKDLDFEVVRHKVGIARLNRLVSVYENNDVFGIKACLTLAINHHLAVLEGKDVLLTARSVESAISSTLRSIQKMETAAWKVWLAAMAEQSSELDQIGWAMVSVVKSLSFAAESAAASVRFLGLAKEVPSSARCAAYAVRYSLAAKMTTSELDVVEAATWKAEAGTLIALLSEQNKPLEGVV